VLHASSPSFCALFWNRIRHLLLLNRRYINLILLCWLALTSIADFYIVLVWYLEAHILRERDTWFITITMCVPYVLLQHNNVERGFPPRNFRWVIGPPFPCHTKIFHHLTYIFLFLSIITILQYIRPSPTTMDPTHHKPSFP